MNMNSHPTIITLPEIKKLIDLPMLEKSIEEGFATYSHGLVEMPMPAHLPLSECNGECHIKYGYIPGDQHFVVKIATGFTDNSQHNLPSGHGILLVFSSVTGFVEAIIFDEQYLTDLRTALAGKIAAKYLAPSVVQRIGIVGTGVQAKMQLEILRGLIACRDVLIYGRTLAHAERFTQELSAAGYKARVTNLEEIASECDFIITATYSRSPLLTHADKLKPRTHITAVGADGNGKQEVSVEVLKRVDLIVVDSKAQSLKLGDAGFAVRAGMLNPDDLIELGDVIRNPEKFGRQSDEQITLCDLTGLAIQDIKTAIHVYERHCLVNPGTALAARL
jgi:ornithine cyclodeaminase